MTTRALRSVVGAAIAAAMLWLGAPPAMAHEFKVVLVESDTGTTADARRGFRLAVDRSPDVSHPPDEEAGDHLGGVDMDIVSDQVASPSVADDVSALLDAGASAVVVLATESVAETAVASAVARGKLVLVIEMTGSGVVARGQIVLRPADGGDERRLAGFVAAFIAAWGSAPTDAAMLGYDAGMLLDALVGEVGDDLQPGPDLAAAANAAADQLVLARLDVASDGYSAAAVDDTATSTGRSRAALTFAAAVCGALVVGMGGAAIRRTHRRRAVRTGTSNFR